MAVICF